MVHDEHRAAHCETRCSRTASQAGSLATTFESTCCAGNPKLSKMHSRVWLQSMRALRSLIG